MNKYDAKELRDYIGKIARGEVSLFAVREQVEEWEEVRYVSIKIDGGSYSVRELSDITYEWVVERAGYDPKRILSVTFRESHAAGGILHHGQSVQAVPGMRFEVADTSSA